MTTLWYVGRGAGVVTLALFSVVVALGIVTRSARPLLGLPRFAVQRVHRSASLLALTFLTLHVTTMVVDPYAQIRLVDLLVPFRADFRPLAVGLGTVALDLAAALVVTGLLRARMPQPAWRAVHWLAYLMWPVAAAHALLAGTDRSQAWLLAAWFGCLLLVLAAVAWRLTPNFQDRTEHRRRTPVGAVAGSVPR